MSLRINDLIINEKEKEKKKNKEMNNLLSI